MRVPAQDAVVTNLLAANSLDGIAAIDTGGMFMYWNPVMERLTGVTGAEVLGRSMRDKLPLGEAAHLSAALAGETRSAAQLAHQWPESGEPCFLDVTYTPLRGHEGRIVGALATFRDVTPHRRSEIELLENERRFRELFDDAPVAYHEIDREGIIRRVNRAECELLGFRLQEMLGRHVSDFVAPEEREESRAAVRRKMAASAPLAPFHRHYLRRDGTPVALENHEKHLRDEAGRVVGIRSALLDITQRLRAEEELRRAHDLLEARVAERTVELERANAALRKEVAERRRAQQLMGLQYGVARVLAETEDVGAMIRAAGEAMLRALGWGLGVCWTVDADARLLRFSQQWSCGGTWGAAAAGTCFAPQVGLPGRLWASRQPVWAADLQAEPALLWGEAPGAVRPGGGLLFPVLAGTEVTAVIGLFSREPQPLDQEILDTAALTGRQIGRLIERKRSQQALHESEERFSAFMRYLPGIAFIKDLYGQYVFCNAAFERFFDGGPESVLGRTPAEVWPPELAEVYREHDLQVLATRCAIEAIEPVIVKGERHSFLVYKFPILDEAGEPRFVAGIGVDTTERKRLEEQLRQSQKMEAVGRLAGGVAHDFNNLLTIISGYARMLLDEMKPEDAAHSRLEDIARAADRAAVLTSQLLAFSRRQVVQPRLLEINHLVSNMERMLRRVIGEHFGLKTELAPNLPRIKADPGQVEQIIMNLAVNARDAMMNGGELRIATGCAGDPPNWVRLTVSDTGVGIEPHVMAHIFEPFFTTKERGRGTGLGLSTVYGIVKQHGGEISVDSAPGAGATFHIDFPAAREQSEPQPDGSLRPRAAAGSETVLVVEDEDAVRMLACEILRRGGYRVLEAPGGAEALRLSEESGGSIDLLLTDLVMPIMSGRELSERMQALRRCARVLYMSGYTDDVIAYRGKLDPSVAFLQKPFTPDSLVRKVREVLDAPAGRTQSV